MPPADSPPFIGLHIGEGGTTKLYGSNRTATEETIAALDAAGRLDTVDSARVAALRSLADAIDANPANATLWREYRAAEAALREVNDDDTDGIAGLLERLSAKVGNEAKPGKANARR